MKWLAFLLAFIASPAAAQQPACEPLADVIKSLPDKTVWTMHASVPLIKAQRTFQGVHPSGLFPEADRLLIVRLPDGRTILAFVKDYAICHHVGFAEGEQRALLRFLIGDEA